MLALRQFSRTLTKQHKSIGGPIVVTAPFRRIESCGRINELRCRVAQLRRVQSEMEELKKVVEAVQSLDPATAPAATDAPAPQAAAEAMAAAPTATSASLDDSLEQAVESAAAAITPKQEEDDGSASGTVVRLTLPVRAGGEDVVGNPLSHIFSAVFGPSPGSFFFPSYSVGAEQAEVRDICKSPRILTNLHDCKARLPMELRSSVRILEKIMSDIFLTKHRRSMRFPFSLSDNPGGFRKIPETLQT